MAQLTHWRRHDGELDMVQGGTVETQKGDYPIAASACGRIVFQGASTRDPSLATCPECQQVYVLLGRPGAPRPTFVEAQCNVCGEFFDVVPEVSTDVVGFMRGLRAKEDAHRPRCPGPNPQPIATEGGV